MSASGWTGGQYSLVRALLGLALAVWFARLWPVAAELYSDLGVLAELSPEATPGPLARIDDPTTARAAVAIGGVLATLFAIGFRARIAALGLHATLALLAARNPLTADSGLDFLGLTLLFHAALPSAPYGSIDAVGRLDPRGAWRFPPALHRAAWVALAGTTLYSGVVKAFDPAWRSGTALERLFEGPLAAPFAIDLLAGLPPLVLAAATWSVLAFQLAFVPLARLPRARPWLWVAMALSSAAVIVLADSPDAGFGRLALLGLCFAPRWIAPLASRAPELVLYDGHCGLCHRAVRFVLAEDTGAEPRFRYAPIDGATFRATVPEALRPDLPDSVLVVTQDGELLDRSRAAMRLGAGLGGLWRLLAAAAEAVPLALRDRAYDLVANIRHRLFPTPDEACPLLPPDLRARFDE
ncbi:MAG: DCC1-like thiol-disulfide oxidoreductase family protein [Planctomycetota bacterium]